MTFEPNSNAPYNVSWLLTNNCNYSCGFCWRVLDRKKLSLADALSITQKLAAAGMSKMSWAGGEPLLFKGLKTLIEETSRLGVETMLITNGALIDRVWPTGLPQGLDWLTLPLEGIGDAINVRAGRQEGHYERVLKLLDRYRSEPVRLKMNSVALGFNTKELLEIPQHLDAWGVERWKVFQFYPVRGFAEANRQEYEMSDEAFEEFRVELLERCERLDVRATVVAESTRDLDNSYYTLSPDGCVYVSMDGKDVYLGDLAKDDPGIIFANPLLDKDKYNERSGWVLEPRRPIWKG
ncbi:radical SAM protein [Arthrobacter sp. Cr_A7]|uniref:radical SAM protein n=1 Tax=Arthrobacter sp. Cr_A7 TaxID=3031017 RepID=UPI0023DA3E67|nr:radical SAM protein [Arthrobacter sp. Cr_A7]MDF2051176.1 radical SAM protein [Arthrobacter sp. Cr_A7]